MVVLRNCVILVVASATLWGGHAHADDASPPRGPPPADPAADASAPEVVPEAGEPADAAEPDVHGTADPVVPGEAIEIFDERPDKPFDRDTEIRLTGAELAERGAVDLATALALLPDVTVRDAGRGGFNIDVRGARKGAVSVLIDGVPVSDPYYGTFDVSTVPITDIVQIRVATTPQSPIDGPGGPGGVIEVHTRDAIGPQVVIGRLTADSLPSLGMTGTARVALARALGLRLSASGLGGARDLELPGDAAIDEGRRAATGAARLEYRSGDRRIALDAFLDRRGYVSPPSDTMRSAILLIDRETTARASVKADDRIGGLQLQAQAWTHYLSRRSRSFLDPALGAPQQLEDLEALRTGATALATRAFLRDLRWAASATVDFERAAATDIADRTVRGHTTLVEAAADLQYERRRFRVDLAVGLAAPFGVGARPWPEAKAVARLKPRGDLELTATAAYKGRVPSLRERFDDNGNRELGPERVAHAELRAVQHIAGRVRVELAPYYKRSTGMIRSSVDPMDMGRLVNLGEVTLRGVDAQARVSPHRLVEAGGGYGYIRARSNETGDDPIDRLPRHRWDAWVRARPGAWLSALARVKYVGSAIDQTRRVGGHALVEGSVSAQLSAQYHAVLRVDDLTDVRPETRAGYHGAGRVISIVMQGTWD